MKLGKSKDTDIHEPDGIILPGEKVGHGDARSRIRRRDGIILPGEEMGYVDEKGKIRRPDGIFLRGEVVGQVKDGKAAHAEDGIFLPGEEWGYVDEDGNIRQRDGIFLSGRIIGKMRGKNKAATLGYFVLRFKDMEERYEELERQVRSETNKVKYLARVRRMLEYVPKADALGDFDSLMKRLRSLEQEILKVQSEHQQSKEELCRQAEALSTSTDWKATGEALKTLRDKWKQVGNAGKEHEQRLWQRFQAAQDKFYQRRKEHFEKSDRERQENRRKKESLCAKAESLSGSTDWKATGDALKALQKEWKQVGNAGRDYEEQLWQRFRSAQDKFFERRNAFYEQRKREQNENLRRKEQLCTTAESLAHSSDMRAATQKVKELQAQWKTIGHVPRERADDIWNRFRSACDSVFERSREEHERKRAEWESRMHETLSRKRQKVEQLQESIRHDRGNIDRWHDTIYNLRPGGRADEIRYSLESKISDVEDKIRSKQDRIDELEASIRDIESKLRS